VFRKEPAAYLPEDRQTGWGDESYCRKTARMRTFALPWRQTRLALCRRCQAATAAVESALNASCADAPRRVEKRLAGHPAVAIQGRAEILNDPEQWDREALPRFSPTGPRKSRCWDNTAIGGPGELMRNALNHRFWSFKHPDSSRFGNPCTAQLALINQAMWDKYHSRNWPAGFRDQQADHRAQGGDADPANYEDRQVPDRSPRQTAPSPDVPIPAAMRVAWLCRFASNLDKGAVRMRYQRHQNPPAAHGAGSRIVPSAERRWSCRHCRGGVESS